MHRCILSIVLFITATISIADENSLDRPAQPSQGATESINQQKIHTAWYFSLGQVSIDENAIVDKNMYIDDSATNWKLGWEKQKDTLVYGLGFSSFIYSDNKGFSQRVESTFGGESTEDSSAIAYNLFGEIGYRHPYSDNVDLDILGGVEFVFSSERSIGSCSNCYSEDIDLDSGFYLSPRVNFRFENDWYLGLSYTSYVTGDVNNGISLTVGKQY